MVLAMWGDITGTFVSGTLLAIAAHLISRGGRRWQSLSRARHELEVAALLDHAPELAGRIRERAYARLEIYLVEARTERHASVLSGTVATAAAVCSLWLGLSMLKEEDSSQWASHVLVGAVGAIVWHVVRWSVKPVIRRGLSMSRLLDRPLRSSEGNRAQTPAQGQDEQERISDDLRR